MYTFFFILLFLNSNAFPPIRAEPHAGKLNETQKEALREFVRQVLNLDLPEPAGKIAGNVSRDGLKAIQSEAGSKSNVTKPNSATEKNNKFPKHMLELFEKYSFQNMVGRETVRSIEPMKDFVPHFKDILVFNLTAVGTAEKVRSAQLHIHRRRLVGPRAQAKTRLPPPCRVRLYQLLTAPSPAPAQSERAEMERTKLRSLDSVLVAQVTRGGWHTIDISMALKEMLNSPTAGGPAIFGVRFEGPRGKAITAQHFLKETGDNMSSSFIVVFTEDNSLSDGIVQDPTKLNHQQLQMVTELLEKSSIVIPELTEKFKSKVESKRAGSNFYIYDKSRQIKKNSKKNKGFDIDPIRHERKYYRESHPSEKKSKDLFSNDVDNNNDIEKVKPNQGLSPGNGDIIELLDYNRVRQVNKLRRHNHKTINSLNLRYDTATRKVVQKKLGKARHSAPKSEDYHKKRNSALSRELLEQGYTEVPQSNIFITSNPNDNTRLRRSVPDESNAGPDYENSKVNDKTVIADYAFNKHEKESSNEKEFETEDDMGDLSYDFNSNKYSKHSAQESVNTYSNDGIEPEFKHDNIVHNYLENDHLKKFSDIPLDTDWEDKNIEEADGLKSKMEKKTFSIEKDESERSDNIAGSRGAEKRRHKNQRKSRRRMGGMLYEKMEAIAENEVPYKDLNDSTTSSFCRVTKLQLNFADIGWDDIVITPESIDIGLCAGSCPLSFVMNTEEKCGNKVSNHAIMQAMLSALHRDKRVPEPCCTPDEMETQQLLLFENPHSVIMKSFSEMSVKSCKCR